MPNTETVLFYCPDPILALQAGKVFLSLKIRLRSVDAARTGQTLGALLGVKGYAEVPDAPARSAPNRPVLVLSGFDRARMDALFAALRRAGVPSIDLKAVVTPTNTAWVFADLCAELSREHEAMHGGSQ